MTKKLFYTFYLLVLKIVYGFEKWHFTNNFETIKYKKIITDKLNSNYNFKKVVEFGCGLGEILKHIKSNEKIGIDISTKVLKGARVLNRQAKFYQGSLLYPTEKTDLLITLNWIHSIEFDQLLEMLIPHLKNTNFFMFDIIKDDVEGYQFYHKEFLSQLNSFKMEMILYTDNTRKIYLFKKIK